MQFEPMLSEDQLHLKETLSLWKLKAGGACCAAITKRHSLGAWTTGSYSPSVLGTRDLKCRGQVGCFLVPSGLPARLSPASPGFPWLVAAPLRSLPLSSAASFPLCLCAKLPFPYKVAGHCIRTPDPVGFHLKISQVLISAKTLLLGTEGRMWTCLCKGEVASDSTLSTCQKSKIP